jgi:SMI1-KNR4 cell-wall
MMLRLIETLKVLAPPPEVPVAAGSADLWPGVEAELGTTLPQDYKEFITLYGYGEFNDLFEVMTPFHPDPRDTLVAAYPLYLESYNDGRDSMPEACPYPMFPERGGLLPMATDSNGNTMFWLTEGEPDRWILVHYDWRGGYVQTRYEMGIVSYLIGWLSGALPDCFAGAGRRFLGKTNPTFRPESIRTVPSVT